MNSRNVLQAMIGLATVALLVGCGSQEIAPTATPTPEPVVATPTPEPLVATLTTREGVEAVLSNPTIFYAWLQPENQEAILTEGVFVRFDYVHTIEVERRIDNARLHAPITVTLLNGDILTYDLFDPAVRVEGDTDLGHYDISLMEIESMVFQHPTPLTTLPISPPLATEEEAIAATVTIRAGITIDVSDLVVHNYSKKTNLDEIYRYIQLESGFQIDFEKIERIEFADITKEKAIQEQEWNKVTITLIDGTTIEDKVQRARWDVEGNAALGRFDVGLMDIKSIVFQR